MTAYVHLLVLTFLKKLLKNTLKRALGKVGWYIDRYREIDIIDSCIYIHKYK